MAAARRISVAEPSAWHAPQLVTPDATPEPDPARPRLLFVDDDERILNALRSLVRGDYDAVTVTDGEQALEALKADVFDVIVSDQRMPKMAGVEVLRRAREIAPETVRILLTGYSDLASMVGSINEGEIYRFVSKPWDNQELTRTLHGAVAVSRALREMRRGSKPPHVVDGTLLVIEREPDLIRSVRDLFGRRYKVRYAPSCEDALDLMVKEDVAVVLVDVDGHEAHMTTMLQLLKQEQPQMLAIVATRASDSEYLIELINQAQIYRFLTKPPDPQLLKQHVEAALGRHRALRQSPELAQQQKAEPPPRTLRESDLGEHILQKLSLLRRHASGG
jgi:serine/threonine-protein kinase